MSNIVNVDFRSRAVRSGAAAHPHAETVAARASGPSSEAVAGMLDFGRHFVTAHKEVRALHAECHKLIVSTNNLGESARAMSRAVATLQGALDNFREAAVGDVARRAIREAFAS